MSWFKRLVGAEKGAAKQPASASSTPEPDWPAIQARHRERTTVRRPALEELFGGAVQSVVPDEELRIVEEDPAIVDVFIFEMATERHGDIQIAVTNGLSDRRMVDPDDPSRWARRELIQYFPRCTRGHAKRLRDMAWAALEEPLFLDTCHTLAWHRAAVEGTPWTSAFFLEPLLRPHREFEMTVDGDPVTLLWHIPISEAEREFKVRHGADALIDRLQEVELPWIFDEANRPSLLP